MRRTRLAIPLALLGTLVLASTALAGGWAEVTLTDPPVDPGPGTPTEVTFTVLQHGETPIDWTALTVVATDPTSGTVVRAEATPTDVLGRYVAVITFPTEGDWRLTYESTDLVMNGMATLSVAAAVPVVPATPVVTEAAPAIDPLAVVLVGISLVTLLAVVAFTVRHRPGRRHESSVATG